MKSLPRVLLVACIASCLASAGGSQVAPQCDPSAEPRLAGALGSEDEAFLEPLAVIPVEVTVAPPPTFEDQLIELVNQARQNCSDTSFYCVSHAVACEYTVCSSPRPPLRRARVLSLASEGHSTAMGVRNFHMHCDPDTGTLPGNRALAVGWPTASVGENIAAGYGSPAAVMSTSNGWMSDCGHCANILSAGSREIGLGFSFDAADQSPGNVRLSPTGLCPATSSNNGPYFNYWTQDFSSRPGVYPLVIEREAYLVDTANVGLYQYQPTGTGLQMRFSNDGVTWSSPVSFSTSSAWTLTTGDGPKTVYSEVTGSAGSFRACDRIWLDGSGSASDTIFGESFECGGDSLDLWDLAFPPPPPWAALGSPSLASAAPFRIRARPHVAWQ
jgi:uncharacterized protein YkwD